MKKKKKMEIKASILMLSAILSCICAGAWERKGFSAEGKVLFEASFNTREGISDRYGLAYVMPLDRQLNQVGMDLARVNKLSVLTGAANIGLGYNKVFTNGVTLCAHADADFLWGSAGSTLVLLKKAGISALLPFGRKESEAMLSFGHDIHPLAEDAPEVFSYGGGIPFNPFGYAPQLSAAFRFGKLFSMKAAALWQSEYPTYGPEGVTTNYIRYSMTPEAFLDMRVESRGWTAALQADYLLTKPRLMGKYPFTDVTVFVNDRMDALCGSAFLRYKTSFKNNTLIDIRGKAIYNRGMNHLNMLGGYVIKDVSEDIAMRQYCSINTVSSWMTISYGSAFKGHLFGGYFQNLGSDVAPYSTSQLFFSFDAYNINYLWKAGGAISWSWKSLSIALEYGMSRAYYGDRDEIDPNNCLCKRRFHSVDNHRATLVTSWKF